MGKMPLGVYKISEEQFSELFNGKVYQGSVKKYQNISILIFHIIITIYYIFMGSTKASVFFSLFSIKAGFFGVLIKIVLVSLNCNASIR